MLHMYSNVCNGILSGDDHLPQGMHLICRIALASAHMRLRSHLLIIASVGPFRGYRKLNGASVRNYTCSTSLRRFFPMVQRDPILVQGSRVRC